MGPQEFSDLHAHGQVSQNGLRNRVATVVRNVISLLDGGSYCTLVGLLRKAGRK